MPTLFNNILHHTSTKTVANEPHPLLDRRSFPSETLKEIRSLQKLNTNFNWMILLFFLLWFGSGWVASHGRSLLIIVPAIAVAGMSISALASLMHEACHHLLSKDRRWNRWLGVIAGAPALVSCTAYRSIHLVHHSFTRTDMDPDDIENTAPKMIPKAVLHALILLLGIYVYLVIVPIEGYRHAKRAERRKIVLEYMMIFGFVFLAIVLLPPHVLLFGWGLPMLVGGQLANVRGLSEHGFTIRGNPFLDTRTVISTRIVRFFMCNLNFHIEHHLWPGIPWYNLPKLHMAIQPELERSGASIYRGYLRFLWDVLRAARSETQLESARIV